MSKYIKITDIPFKDLAEEHNTDIKVLVAFASDVLSLPTIDIVHCKDCKHVEYTPASSWKRPYVCRISGSGLGYCPDDGNGFCPYGERKESEIEIVRCKDCEYWDTSWTEDSTGFCGNVDGRTTPDFFCADGERKESEEG